MSFFFFNDTATTEIYTLSLHDALPIFFGYFTLDCLTAEDERSFYTRARFRMSHRQIIFRPTRSEEHTSELQSRSDLVCRLLLEKKKKKKHRTITILGCEAAQGRALDAC